MSAKKKEMSVELAHSFGRSSLTKNSKLKASRRGMLPARACEREGRYSIREKPRSEGKFVSGLSAGEKSTS